MGNPSDSSFILIEKSPGQFRNNKIEERPGPMSSRTLPGTNNLKKPGTNQTRFRTS